MFDNDNESGLSTQLQVSLISIVNCLIPIIYVLIMIMTLVYLSTQL